MIELKKEFFFQKIKEALKNYQFKTFLIGIVNKEITEEEKKQSKKILGQLLERKLKKEVDFANPDIVIKIDVESKKIDYQIKPIFIFGRYQKIKAGIPQTRWHKKIYKTSVQEEIGNVILKYCQGEDHSFHGAGREDIDVLMLGNGRPFVIEIKNPKIRNIDLTKIEKEVNTQSKWVRVKDLQFVNKEKIREIKNANHSKIYEAKIQLEKKVKKDILIEISKKLTNITIQQQTPTRVLRRRYDLTRTKKIFYFKLIKFHSLNPIFEIKSQSGTYIKELISGDDGRTKPSLSQLLQQKCFVKELKVVKIED